MSYRLVAKTGVIFVDDPEGEREIPTFTCPHCCAVGVVGQDDGGWCYRCARLLCKKDGCHGECVPFLKLVEKSITDSLRRRA